jgi:hypothetical protein
MSKKIETLIRKLPSILNGILTSERMNQRTNTLSFLRPAKAKHPAKFFAQTFWGLCLLFLFVSNSLSAGNPPRSLKTATEQGEIVALFTPFSYFEKAMQKIINSTSIQEHANLPNQIVKVDQLDWHINGVSYDIQTEFNPGTLTANTYEISSRKLKLAITIQQISVDQMITKVFGGVTLQIHVQATCAPVTLVQNSAQAAARVIYQISPQNISTHVDQLSLQWPSQSWIISPVSCQGPSGLDEQIRTALINQLQTADAVKPYLETGLSQKIQSGVEAALNQIKQPTPIAVPGNPLQLVLTFGQFQMTSSGLISYAALSWAGAPEFKNIRPLQLKEVPPEIVTSQTPILISSTEGWTDFIRAELLASPQETRVSLNDQQNFRQILASSFLEYFFWPDLLNYSKRAPFSLAIQTPDLQDLTWQANGTAQANLVTTAWMQSVRAKKNWNYIKLNGQAKAELTPQIKNGQFTLAAKITDTNLTEAFGPDYVKQFHPNTYVNKFFIDRISSSVETTFHFSNALPDLDLGVLGLGRFNGWLGLQNNLIAIPIDIRSK